MVVQQQLQIAILCGLMAGCVDPAPWRTTAGQEGDWRDEVIYQLLVDRFGNGDLNNDFRVVDGSLGLYQGGDWQGVIDHLDYLEDLGVTALWISPVVRNLETDANFDAYHGYWQQDFTQVNPHFGDLHKLRELVQRAHQKKFKVILDIVTNHVGQLFYYDINGNGHPDENVYGAGCGVAPPADKQPCPQNPPLITHLTEYDPDFDPVGVRGYTSLGFSGPAPVRWIYDAAINRQPTMPGAHAEDGPGRQFGFNREDWYHRKGRIVDYGARQQVLEGDFPGGLKDLATERPDTEAALTAVFARWIQAADFDGFRIDTLKHVDHPFWQQFCTKLRKYCAGKINLPDPTVESDPGAVVPPLNVPKQKFFMFGESFDGNDDLNGSYTMNQEVDSTFYFSQKFSVFDTVFKNGGPTTAIMEQLQRQRAKYAATPNEDGIGVAARDVLVNFMDNHDVTRFLFDKPSLPALWNALAFLFTENGIPCLYYGTEQELYGGNDPTNRERLWDTGYRTDGATFKLIQTLIKIRKAYAPLRRGDMQIKWSTDHVGAEQDAGMFGFERTDGSKTVLVVLNTHDTKMSETSTSATGGGQMMTAFAAGTQLVDVLKMDGQAGATFTVGPGGALTVPVAARGAKILVPSTDVVP
jgi:alpha-amylase